MSTLNSEQFDLGFTHVALVCSNADRTIEFYTRYADLRVVHDRQDNGRRVFWLSDMRRPFAIVFLESAQTEAPLGPFGHLGVCLPSRADVDRILEMARRDGVHVSGPTNSGPPVGYWAFLRDPDGHTLEVSHGQEIQLHVGRASEQP